MEIFFARFHRTKDLNAMSAPGSQEKFANND
jgi:hypothetical protein